MQAFCLYPESLLTPAKKNEHRYVALYERLSHDDEQQGESNSISNQESNLQSFCIFLICTFRFVPDFASFVKIFVYFSAKIQDYFIDFYMIIRYTIYNIF